MDPVVRLAEDGDIDDLLQLEILARMGAADVKGGVLLLGEHGATDDWRALLGEKGAFVFVGTLDDVVCSYLVLRLDVGRDRGVISQAFVQLEARELGLGDTMVEHAVDTVRTAGLAGIEAFALPGDRETKNLFERAGLTARLITVYKSLATAPTSTT